MSTHLSFHGSSDSPPFLGFKNQLEGAVCCDPKARLSRKFSSPGCNIAIAPFVVGDLKEIGLTRWG